MMHDRADTIDTDPPVGGFAVPQPPMQTLDLCDDHCLRRRPRRIVARQTAGGLPEVLESHSDMEPVQKRRRGDAGLSENASESGTTIGESGQCRLPGASDGVKVPVDQSFDVRFRSGEGTENLAGAGFRFDIADTHLEMPLPCLATPDEGRIQ